MVRGSIREKSHEAMPSCGGSSSATASLGYGSHGTKRAKSGCKSRSAWKTRSWILAPRRSGGLTTTCKDAVVWETRATESQEILTEGGASGFVCAAAGCRLPNRSSERPASTMRVIGGSSTRILAPWGRRRTRLQFNKNDVRGPEENMPPGMGSAQRAPRLKGYATVQAPSECGLLRRRGRRRV